MKKTLFIALTIITLPIMGMDLTVAKTHKVKVILNGHMTQKDSDKPLNMSFDDADKKRCENIGITWSKKDGIVRVLKAIYTNHPTRNEYDLTKLPYPNTFINSPQATTDPLFFPSVLPVDLVRKLKNGPVTIETTNPAGEVLRIEITAENIPSLPFTTSAKVFIGGVFVGIASFIAWFLATDDANPHKAQILNFIYSLMPAKQ